MTKRINAKDEIDDFLKEICQVVETEDYEEIKLKLSDKDEDYFCEYSMIIHLSKVDCEQLEVKIDEISENEEAGNLEIVLKYFYIGTHLRKERHESVRVTMLSLEKSRVLEKEIVIKEEFENYFIDHPVERKLFYKYASDSKEEHMQYWHVKDKSGFSNIVQWIQEEYEDVTQSYGGLLCANQTIDWSKQEAVVALVESNNLPVHESDIEAYKIVTEQMLGIEMHYNQQLKAAEAQEENIGIVVIPLLKEESGKQKVVVGFPV